MPNATEIKSIIEDLQHSYDIEDERIQIVVTESLLGFTPTIKARAELFGSKDNYFLPSQPLDDDAPAGTGIAVLNHPYNDYSKTIRRLSRKISKNLIGIALGSGAALGFAHIGVLKVLEKENVPIDAISGSSMGAIVGAFAAAGFSCDKMGRIAASFNLFRMIMRIDFDLFPIKGFIIGKQIAKLFAGHLKDKQFEDLKIPLYIVASNIRTRKALILKNGSLIDAIRASIAIPGVFHPMKLNGETFIDGGIIDPLPIRPLSKTGINKIIAVDVLPSSDSIIEKNRYRDELKRRLEMRIKNRNMVIRSLYGLKKAFGRVFTPNLFDILVNSIQTMEHEIAQSLYEEADIVIKPRMPHMEWVEFHKAKEMINCGEAAARERVDEIKALVKQSTA